MAKTRAYLFCFVCFCLGMWMGIAAKDRALLKTCLDSSFFVFDSTYYGCYKVSSDRDRRISE